MAIIKITDDARFDRIQELYDDYKDIIKEVDLNGSSD